LEKITLVIKPILFPCLLSWVVLISLVNIYEDIHIGVVAVLLIVNLILFTLYEKLRVYNKSWLSTIIVVAGLFLCLFFATQIVRLEGDNYRFLGDWFFKTADADLHFPMFTLALMFLFVPFISMTVFYFTNVSYNSFFLMLTCMTTFALYAKTFTKIPFIFPSLIIALFLFVSIEKRWYNVTAMRALSYRRFITVGVCFVAISAYIAGLFPPATTTPYREQFDEFISGRHWNAPVNFTDIIDAPRSGANNPNADDERLLFTISTNEELQYLRRQVFDEWSGEYWINDNPERTQTGLAKWFDSRDEATQGGYAGITVHTDSNFRFVPIPPHPTSIEIDSGETASISIRGEVMATDPIEAYYVSFPRFDIQEETVISEESLFPLEYQEYIKSTLDLPSYPRQGEVRELAQQITDGFNNDYDKARALSDYFYEEAHGFTYDGDFVPQSKAVDYFLFDSRTGTCSDFATAMTIMAREIGLPARYVEGYIVEERDDYGKYVVKTKHGHAFPEVFIEGRGWIIFEPTIPGVEGTGGFGYNTILTVLIIVGVLAVMTVLFIIFAVPVITERRFRKTAVNSSRENQVKLIYNKIYCEFMKNLKISERTLSSHDLDCICEAEYGVRLYELTNSYDRVVYGGIGAGDGDFYGTYMEFCSAVKSINKSNKLIHKPVKSIISQWRKQGGNYEQH
jgi:hypothetical protein